MTITETDGKGRTSAPPEHSASHYVKLGDLSRDARDWQRAREHYQQAVHLNPSLQPIWIQLGHAAKESGDFGAAESAYRKALEINPKDADGHLQLGHLLKLSGQASAAMESYAKAAELDYRLVDAHTEIAALKDTVRAKGNGGGGRRSATTLLSAVRKLSGTDALAIVFEVSDLVSYFRNSRLPTGIQRVQMEVIRSVIEAEAPDLAYSIVCFDPESQFWVEIPAHLFLRFCRSSVLSGDLAAHDWRSVMDDLDRVLSHGQHFRFPPGSILLDLGTSWWQRNYFLTLRFARSAYHLRYVPFVHDLIPVMTPEFCSRDLRRDFVAWVSNVMDHADFFLVNSHATLSDLHTVAKQLGHELPAAAVVTLDADFRRSVDELEQDYPEELAAAFLAAHGVKSGHYILCVATIEARKNHVMAFSAWLRLIKKYGVKKVPKLVCVGKDGWLMDAAYATLKASEILMEHVVILHSISDPELAALYRNCLCTLYPSSYEGWGLPVTEALCYGKVPIISNVSSLPEAGGKFAEYFDIQSEKDLMEKVEKLTFDEDFRRQREREIAAEFRPRSWREVAEQIVSELRNAALADQDSALPEGDSPPGIWPVKAEAGVLHQIALGTDSLLWAGARCGEVYRNGLGWWWPESWGCWIKGTGPATLAFLLDGVAEKAIVVYLGLRGAVHESCTCSVKSEGTPSLEVLLTPEQDRVIALEIAPEQEAQRLVVITITSDTAVDLAQVTKGADKRVTGPGVRWFYACRKDDLLARMAMTEALCLNDFKRLMPQPPASPDYFLHT